MLPVDAPQLAAIRAALTARAHCYEDPRSFIDGIDVALAAVATQASVDTAQPHATTNRRDGHGTAAPDTRHQRGA